MLSGFLLRADAGLAQQALPVLRTLLGLIPFAGAAMQRLLTGAGHRPLHHLHSPCLHRNSDHLAGYGGTQPAPRADSAVAPRGSLRRPSFSSSSLCRVWSGARQRLKRGHGTWLACRSLLHWLPRPQLAIWLGGLVLVLLHCVAGDSHCASIAAIRYALSTLVVLLCCAHPDRTRLSGRWLAMDYSRRRSGWRV